MLIAYAWPMRAVSAILPLIVAFLFAGCVAKTYYDDQEVKLEAAEVQLDAYKEANLKCDTATLVEYREQTQSLDMLAQELLQKNAKLSREVARLTVVEGSVKAEATKCNAQIGAKDAEWEAKLARTRATFEDLLAEKKKEILKLRQSLKKAENKLKGKKKKKKG